MDLYPRPVRPQKNGDSIFNMLPQVRERKFACDEFRRDRAEEQKN